VNLFLIIMHYLLTLMLVSLAASSIGWVYFIYFFSLGYGYGIAALALALVAIFWNALTLPTIALCVAFFIFGCRLGTYLLIRQNKEASYRKILYNAELNANGKPIGVVIAVWFFCALLYVCQVSPVAFRLANAGNGLPVSDVWAWIGTVVFLVGIWLEAAADAQKSASKKRDPKAFVSTGLYSIVRCPNYLGEVMMWTGAFVSGFGASLSIWQWSVVLTGYAGILYVMFSGARRLELRQNEVYGNDEKYQAYAKSTPILIPFVPIYSVAKYEWLQA